MVEKTKVESDGKYSYGCTLDSGEEIVVTRVGDRWAFSTTDLTHGATAEDFYPNGQKTLRAFGLTDEALFMTEMLVRSIRADQAGAVFGGIVDDRDARIAALEKTVMNLEDENENVRGENDLLSEENDTFRMNVEHQYADVYLELRRILGISSPLSEASVVDTVTDLIEALHETRVALLDLVKLKIHRAQKGNDAEYAERKIKAWTRAFRIVGKSKMLEMGLVRLSDNSTPEDHGKAAASGF